MWVLVRRGRWLPGVRSSISLRNSLRRSLLHWLTCSKTIAGVASQGMLLAADAGGKPMWLTVGDDAPVGSQITWLFFPVFLVISFLVLFFIMRLLWGKVYKNITYVILAMLCSIPEQNMKNDVYKELSERLKTGKTKKKLTGKSNEICTNCLPSSPVMCMELCQIWKLKEIPWYLRSDSQETSSNRYS